MSDDRVAYGMRCMWWDTIDKVGLTEPGASGHRLPCCPCCGGPLFEVPTLKGWMESAHLYEQDVKPGYVAQLEWSRGKCFPNMESLEARYAAER